MLWRQGDSIQNIKIKKILYVFYICLFTILFYLRKVFILVHLKKYYKIYLNYVIQFVTDILFKKLATGNTIATKNFASLLNEMDEEKTCDCHSPLLILYKQIDFRLWKAKKHPGIRSDKC